MTPNAAYPYLGIRFQIKYHKCNLDCPYCIARWKDQEFTFDIETFRAILAKIRQLPYRVCLRIGAGGELFTSTAILAEISNICNEENNVFGVSFSSNLAADWNARIGPFIANTNTARFGIGCTLHDTVIPNVDEFFEKVQRLRDAGVLLYVGYVAVPQRLKYIAEYKQRCDDLGVPLIINALIGDMCGPEPDDPDKLYPRDYTIEEKHLMRELWDTPHSYNLLVESCTSRGMQCSAGRNYIYLTQDGEAYACSNITRSMGNILKEGIAFQAEDTRCPVDVCWCGNENQALRVVDERYDRTRTLRIFHPREEFSREQLFAGYKPSIYSTRHLLTRAVRKAGRVLGLMD